MEKARPIWTCLDKFGQVQTNLDNSRPIWTSVDEFEQVDLEKIVEGIFLNDVFQFCYVCFQVLSENHECHQKVKKV